ITPPWAGRAFIGIAGLFPSCPSKAWPKRSCRSVGGIGAVEQVFGPAFTGYFFAGFSDPICCGPTRVKRLYELLRLRQIIARRYSEHLPVLQSLQDDIPSSPLHELFRTKHGAFKELLPHNAEEVLKQSP